MSLHSSRKRTSLLGLLLVVVVLVIWGCTKQLMDPSDDRMEKTVNPESKMRHFHLLDRARIRAGKNAGQVRLVMGFSSDTVEAQKILERFKILQRFGYKTVYPGMAVSVEEDRLDQVLDDMQTDDRIAWVEPDIGVPLDENNDGQSSDNSSQVEPPSLPKIGIRQAWSQLNPDGGPVDVDLYVLDTGVEHTDLNIAGCLELSADTLQTCQDPGDANGHGTEVAGIAAAVDDSDGLVGVAPGARVHAVKVLDSEGEAELSSIIKIVDYLTQVKRNNPDRPMVVNMSLGGDVETTDYNGLDEAIQASIAEGVVYVISVGNGGTNASTISPAHVTEAITVGAYDQRENRFMSTSNVGSVIDILAPGNNIMTLSSEGAHTTASGTSLAAPHVAGAVSLFLADRPELTPAQVRQELISRAQPIVTGVGQETTNKSLYLGPPQAFEDVDHDGIYDEGQDLLISDDALSDGQYSSSGSNGLVVPPALGTLTASTVRLESSGPLTVRANIQADGVELWSAGTTDIANTMIAADQGPVNITSGGKIIADGSTVEAKTDIFIDGRSAIILAGATLDARESWLNIRTQGEGGDILLSYARLQAKADVTISNDAEMNLDGGTFSSMNGKLTATATGPVSLTQAQITAREVRIENWADIYASGAEITTADNQLEILALGNPGLITVDDAVLAAQNYLRLEVADAAGEVSVAGASLDSQNGTPTAVPDCVTVSGTLASGEITNNCQ